MMLRVLEWIGFCAIVSLACAGSSSPVASFDTSERVVSRGSRRCERSDRFCLVAVQARRGVGYMSHELGEDGVPSTAETGSEHVQYRSEISREDTRIEVTVRGSRRGEAPDEIVVSTRLCELSIAFGDTRVDVECGEEPPLHFY